MTEVALSLVLLIGAGLMLRSFAELQKVDPGFEPDDVVTFSIPLQFVRYATPELRTTFTNELGASLEQLPGVESVGGVAPLPLGGGEQYGVGSYSRPGDPDDVFRANRADFKAAMPGYLETMQIDLVAGRPFRRGDNEVDAELVAMVDEKLAERLWGDEDPVDKQIAADRFNTETFSLERISLRVIGVVSNIRSASLASEERETVYWPYHLNPWFPLTYTVRTSLPPGQLVSAIRQELDAMDPEVPISNVAMMESYVSDAGAETRFMLALIGVFAALALVLASLGLYGVISYSVRQRTREIGVRVAFGASGTDVTGLIVRQGMVVAGAGVVVGLGAAFAMTRVVESLLVGVTSTDPYTFVGIPMILLTVAALATWVPARRAAGVDPVEALRDE